MENKQIKLKRIKIFLLSLCFIIMLFVCNSNISYAAHMKLVGARYGQTGNGPDGHLIEYSLSDGQEFRYCVGTNFTILVQGRQFRWDKNGAYQGWAGSGSPDMNYGNGPIYGKWSLNMGPVGTYWDLYCDDEADPNVKPPPPYDFHVKVVTTNHSPSGWQKTTTQHYKYCTICGRITSAAQNHVWDEGVVVTEPTITTTGTMKYTCTTCGYFKNKEIPVVPSHFIGMTATRTISISDIRAPYGAIVIRNKVSLPHLNKEGINTRNVTLDILGLDSETKVVSYVIKNENQIETPLVDSDWLDFPDNGELVVDNWELSPNDGDKTVYLMLKDYAGNTTVSFIP